MGICGEFCYRSYFPYIVLSLCYCMYCYYVVCCFCCFDCFLLAAILLCYDCLMFLKIYNIMKIERNDKGNLVGTFESPIYIDNDYTNDYRGTRFSEMELFTNDNGTPIFIEWVVDDGTFIEHIGLWFDGKTLEDYDGVFELPVQAAKLIRKVGYKVPTYFLD